MAEINNNSIIFLDNGYLEYNNWNKMPLGDKFKRRLNIAKFQLNNGSLAKAGYALVGGYDPENPNLNTGAPEILPGKVNTSLYKSIRNIKPLYKNINKFLEKKLDFESPTIKKETIIRNTNIENAKLSQSERYKDRKTYTKKERYLDKNNRAYETSKATPVNSGLNKIKNSLLKNIITNIDKYPLYELKNLDKLKLKLAKKGLSRKEIEKHKEVKDFYRGLAEHYGYFKQGGKMNILEFLKNGSGIHIKEKNKGKFTSYCGGKVTDECILKGKNSSNPAIRKRATFAANARKWKHKEGGIIKAEEGTKTNWWSKIGNGLKNFGESKVGQLIISLGLSTIFGGGNSSNNDISKVAEDFNNSKLESINLLRLLNLEYAKNLLESKSDPNNPNATEGVFKNYVLGLINNMYYGELQRQQRLKEELLNQYKKDLETNKWMSIVQGAALEIPSYFSKKLA